MDNYNCAALFTISPPLIPFFFLGGLQQRLLAQVQGDVLEVAAGSLLNAPLYSKGDNVKSITLLEPSRAMLSAGQSRLDSLQAVWPVRVVAASVEEGLGRGGFLDGQSFDTVFETYSLCVLSPSEAESAVSLMAACSRRRLLILDHTLSPNPVISAYQLATAPAVGRLSKGCRGDLDVDKIISYVERTRAFKSVSVERYIYGTIALIAFEF